MKKVNSKSINFSDEIEKHPGKGVIVNFNIFGMKIYCSPSIEF